jgi:hypothetical protein
LAKKVAVEDSALKKQVKTASSRKQKLTVDPSSVPSTKIRLEPGWTRATFIVREEYIEKIKTLAFMGKISMKDLIDKIFDSFFSSKKSLFSSKKDLIPQRQAELLEEFFKE